jgi:uncharacterized sulfatase
MSQPHILFIVLDTQRRDRLSLYGYERETSPALDAFAAAATVFDRAIAPAQWTIPSHASMFTGLYAGAHGVTQGYHHLSGLHPTLAETLQGDGYHTVGFCNNPLVGVLDNGLQRGFDRFYNYAGASSNRPFTRPLSPWQQSLTSRWQRFARPIQNQFAHSERLFRVSMNPWLVPLWTRFIHYKGSTRNSIADLVAYIQQHRAGGADKPLFAFLNLMGVHLPYRPPQPYLDRVAPELSRHSWRFMQRFNNEAARWATPTDPPLQDWEAQTLNAFYAGEVLHQDVDLATLFDYLKTSGALDDTLVIIVADHGEAHGDHGYVGHSFVVNQELVHVPLIIHDPDGRFPAGKRVPTNVSTRRIFHTALEAASVAPPLDEADPNADVAGLSLARATHGRADTEGGVAFAEAFPPTTIIDLLEHRNPAVLERMRLRDVRRGIYDGVHKLTTVDETVEGVYDTLDDPNELRDMAAENPKLTGILQQKLAEFMQADDESDSDTSDAGKVDDRVVENLRALGYIE